MRLWETGHEGIAISPAWTPDEPPYSGLYALWRRMESRPAHERGYSRSPSERWMQRCSIGISMFDHANIYTMGKAEETFGTILKGRPGYASRSLFNRSAAFVLAKGRCPGASTFSRASFLRRLMPACGGSGIDYLDVLLLHRPDPLVEPEEVAEAFGKLKAAGKVRYFGVSNMSVGQIRFLQRALPDQLAVNQLEMSLAALGLA